MTTKSSRCPAPNFAAYGDDFHHLQATIYINTADYGNTAVADDDTSRQVGNSPRPKMQILSLSDGIGFDQGFASSWIPFSSKCKPVCHKDLCARKVQGKDFSVTFSKGQQRKAASSGFAAKLNPFFLSFEHILAQLSSLNCAMFVDTR